MIPLTLAKLAEIEAAAAKATPGPWHQWKKHAAVYSGAPDTNTSYVLAGKGVRQVCDAEQDEFDEDDINNGLNNAAYIALCDPATVAALVRIAKAAIAVVDQDDRGAYVRRNDAASNAMNALRDAGLLE